MIRATVGILVGEGVGGAARFIAGKLIKEMWKIVAEISWGNI